MSSESTKESTKQRRTVNLTQGVWDLVAKESLLDYPGETPLISMTTRVLIREAIDARRVKRGEKPLNDSLR